MPDLSGRVILVTCAAHFVGTGAIHALATAGATVLAQRPQTGTLPAETLDEEAPEALVQAALDRHGRLDGVVSNDFHPAARAPITEADPQALRAALEDLVVTPFRLARAAVPVLRESRGRLVLVTSAAPLQGLPNYAIYVTARGAANMLATTLARELARDGICVNAVAPNFIESESYFLKTLLEDEAKRAKIVGNVPLGRLGRPEEVGALIAFLMSEEAGFLTGHVYPVAGGWP